MNRNRCPDCGERFNSEYHLELHREHACEGSDERRHRASEDPGGTEGGSRSKTGPIATGATGTLTDYDEDGGYGFAVTTDIQQGPDDDVQSSDSVFVHVSDVPDNRMEEGDRFEFDILDTEKGFRATNVRVLKRNEDRNDESDDDRDISRLRFGAQKDETQYGPGKSGPTDQDIRSFKDERKFR